jgi:MFS family permease
MLKSLWEYLLLRDAVGGLPRTFWALFTAMLVNRVGAFGMLLLPTYLTTQRGATLAIAGLVTGGYGAGGAIGTLSGGVLADRWGRRKTYLLGTILSAIFMLGFTVARPLWLIMALAVLTGLTHMLPGPATVAAIADVTPTEDRSRAFNLQFWAFNMGTAIAAAVAGIVAEFSFVALFAADAFMTALTAVVVWRLVPETKPAAVAGKRGGLHTVLADRVFLTFVGLTFVLAFLAVQTSSTVQLAMNADGLRPSVYGLVVSLGGAMIVFGQLFIPKLIKAHRYASVLAVALALMGAGYAALAFADAAWLYLAAAVVWTFGGMLAAPPNASIIADLAPPHLRASYQSVFNLVFPLAFFLAPSIGGWTLGTLGPWHWALCGLLGLAAAAGHLLTARSRDLATSRVSAEPVTASVG